MCETVIELDEPISHRTLCNRWIIKTSILALTFALRHEKLNEKMFSCNEKTYIQLVKVLFKRRNRYFLINSLNMIYFRGYRQFKSINR